MNKQGLGEQFPQSANIKRVFGCWPRHHVRIVEPERPELTIKMGRSVRFIEDGILLENVYYGLGGDASLVNSTSDAGILTFRAVLICSSLNKKLSRSRAASTE